MTIPLTGYADRLSVRPGETISFHVSHNESTKAKKNNKVQTSVVRVISADPHTNPGPGIQTVPIRDAEIDCVNEPGPCATQRGSHAELPLPLHALEKDMTFAVAIMPTLLPTGQQQQTIAFVENVLEVYINPKGHLCAQFGTSSSNTTTTLCCSQRVLPKNHWIQIYCSVALLREDESKREALVGWNWLTRDGSGSSAGVSKGRKGESVKEEISLEQSTTSEETTLYLAAKKSSTPTQPPVCIHHFTGRMEHPWLWWTTPGFPELHIGTHAVMQAKAHPPDAQWHFGRGISTQTVQDFGPHKLHGTVVNCPTRGVRGSNWSGREMCWRHAPDDYAAIHFHAETDLADCNWPVCYQWKIPSDIPSGNYALLLHTD
ncbi:large subunit (Partial), partial [Seminavis robusta]|eukprot:Sro4357_g353820.1 large subunit (373) ;mRNA; f:863-1982